MKHGLKNSVFWMFAGSGTYALMQWFQLAIISKSCTPYTLGSFTLSLAIAAPVFLLFGLQLRNVQVTDSRNEYTFSHYFGLRLYTMLAAFATVCLIGLISRVDMGILTAVAALKGVEGMAEIFNGQQQKLERMEFLALSLSLKGVAATIAIPVGVYCFDSLAAGLALAVALNLVVLFFNDYLNCYRLFGRQRFISLRGVNHKSLLVKSLPLGFVMLIISLNGNIPKYLSEMLLGTEQQGIYSAIAYCLVVGNFVSNAIGQSFSPRLGRYYAEGERGRFVRLSQLFVGCNALVGLALFLFTLVGGEWFLRLAFSPAIAAYARLFSLIMLGGIFANMANALGYSLTAMRVFRIQPFINGIELVVNLAGCYLLIRHYGLFGAGLVAVITPCVRLAILYLVIRHHLHKKIA